MAENEPNHVQSDLVVEDRAGTGILIKAILPDSEQITNHVECKLRTDVPVPIFTSVWTAFATNEWKDMQLANANRLALCWNFHDRLKHFIEVARQLHGHDWAQRMLTPNAPAPTLDQWAEELLNEIKQAEQASSKR